jgi:hypothetical protein
LGCPKRSLEERGALKRSERRLTQRGGLGVAGGAVYKQELIPFRYGGGDPVCRSVFASCA